MIICTIEQHSGDQVYNKGVMESTMVSRMYLVDDDSISTEQLIQTMESIAKAYHAVRKHVDLRRTRGIL